MSHYPLHYSKNVFFGCIDDRLIEPHRLFVEQIGGAFCPSIAGGGLAFISDTDRTVALEQITAAYTINHINSIYIESHTDCGAYRLAGKRFDSLEQEVNCLYDDLEKAKKEIIDALRQIGSDIDKIRVMTRVVDPDGTLLAPR